MEKKAGLYKEYKKHFLLDEGKLRKIADIIRQHAEKYPEKTFIKYRVNRTDDSFFETSDLEEVLSEDNSPNRAIKHLVIELHLHSTGTDTPAAVDVDRKKALVLVFFDGLTKKDDRITVIIQAKDRDWCFLLSDDIDSQIQRILQKSVLPFNFSPRWIDPIFLLAILSIALFYLMYFSSKLSPAFSLDQIRAMTLEERSINTLQLVSKKYSASDWLLPSTWLGMTIAMVFIGLRPISRLIDKLNRSVFYWGDMIAVHDLYEKRAGQIKWGVIIAFVISLLSSIVAAIVMK